LILAPKCCWEIEAFCAVAKSVYLRGWCAAQEIHSRAPTFVSTLNPFSTGRRRRHEMHIRMRYWWIACSKGRNKTWSATSRRSYPKISLPESRTPEFTVRESSSRPSHASLGTRFELRVELAVREPMRNRELQLQEPHFANLCCMRGIEF
jgi:hypothetical protein